MTAQTAPIRSSATGLSPYRVTVREFEKMIDAGVFPASEHIELLAGILCEMPDKMTKNHRHDYVIDILAELLRRLVGDGWVVREEKAIRLGSHWRPEPDISVVRGPRVRYWSGQPTGSDLGLLVEAADATYQTDRKSKWRRYAAAGVASYWIVDIARVRVEVYSEPAGRGASAHYRTSTTYNRGEEIPLVLEGRELGRIEMNNLFPRDAEG